MENINGLTPTELKILSFIRSFMLRHGHAPTLLEIGRGLGMNSKGTVHRYVQALVSKGHLHHTERGWRGIRPTDTPLPSTLPLVGRIAAGHPIEAIPQRDDVTLGDWFQEDRYALEVKGDSMIDAGILDGDIVIVKRQSLAHDGDIVVAIIDNDEATLKRFKRLGPDKITLIPHNPTLSPFVYAAQRIQIQGVVIGQLRRYE
ncbi:MAG: repressor LexA [Gammaproteobacteria bacterium]|nr:repressor LexA [Gammaproteobacteria bacterium]